MTTAAATHDPAIEPEIDDGIRRGGSEADILPRMVYSPAQAKQRLEELQQFISEVMVPSQVDDKGNVTRDGDYGPPFPGSKKKVLLKAGAEKLAEVYGFTVEPVITQRIEKWTEKDGGPFFHYEVEAKIYSKRTGNLVGKGVGSCNSMENRYRYRQGQRECPACGSATIFKSKPQFGGGWYCNQRAGGCGESFKPNSDGAREIEAQVVGKVENDDIHTQVNTILKIAKKRAYIDGVISVTQSSGLLTGEEGDEEQPQQRKRTSGAQATPNGKGKPQQKKEDTAATANKTNDPTKSEGKPPDDAHPHRVTIRGKVHWTAGADEARLLRCWDLSRQLDKQTGTENAAKDALRAVIGVDSTIDLNAEMADKFIAHLVDQLGGDPDDDFPY
jgi:hypothetical protein